MIGHSDLSRVRVRRKIAKWVDRALTPRHVVEGEDFSEPRVITERYFNFNNLVASRCSIRDLRLVPLKEETLHGEYNALSRQTLLDGIVQQMGSEKMILAENQYPYVLPSDTIQSILWVREAHTERHEIVRFLSRLAYVYGLDDLDVILFERPPSSRSKFVKRSFPLMRHIHVWVRNKSGQLKDDLTRKDVFTTD